MKSIVAINTEFPTIEDQVHYFSGESLRDYDIAVFDPSFPSSHRIEFSGGGSCLTIESTQRVKSAISHWAAEIQGALTAGKTVFVLLSEIQEDSGTSGYTTPTKNQRSYATFKINNYESIPFKLNIKNTKGRKILPVESAFKPLLDSMGGIQSYKVVFETQPSHPIYSAKDGAAVGCIVSLNDLTGNLVFLPYLDFAEYDRSSPDKWSEEATQISHGFVGQLIALDKRLRQATNQTPPPPWASSAVTPRAVLTLESEIKDIEAEIHKLSEKQDTLLKEKDRLLAFSRLLYEGGKLLELAIEDALRTLGFKVENYRIGDIEIDHVILGPAGVRMIAESEGKDTSAIDITKFRQLESNINEDFARENASEPAKGVLFGNGFRFTEPSSRPEQFTAKCLTNAKRLGTALVRTSDLYQAVVYALDNPTDDAFLAACRSAIENCTGEVVTFPKGSVLA